MKQSIWHKLKAEATLWRMGGIPGMVIIALVILVRSAGLLQAWELAVFDRFLRWRNAEPLDDRILIVGINEADIRRIGTYPIPDYKLAGLIKKLQTYDPAAIGIDIFRDLPVEPGHDELAKSFQRHSNIFGVEKVLGDAIAPPPSLPPERVGFVDQVLDSNGNLRRSLLSTSDSQGEFQFSLAILLAQIYLDNQGYSLENLPDDEWAMAFDSIPLTRFQPNTGGYVRADAAGNQVLFNFRSGQQSFRMVSLQEIEKGTVNPDWIRDRIILVGITATSIKDVINAPGINAPSGLVYGVEINAHAVSQIISAVLDRRSLISSLNEGGEYLFILLAGLLGISLARIGSSSWQIILCLGFAIVLLVSGSYLILMTQGLWLPIVPAFLVLSINGASLAASNFYRYQQNLKLQLKERQYIIEYTFDTIHNGPLQTLKQLLRETQNQNFPREIVSQKLLQLDRELKAVYQSIQQETVTEEGSIYINNVKINLADPLDEVLYQVYSNTITRDFPCFQTLKYRIVKFEPLDTQGLTVEQKRGLCRFLEEALCNVGKYAQGLTRLKVTCSQEQQKNLIRIEDNGKMSTSSAEHNPIDGRGTEQSLKLARELGGEFKRYNRSPQGTICEIFWFVS